MELELPIRFVLVDPPAGVDFGIQSGAGVRYETLFVQQRRGGDVVFDFSLRVNDTRKDGLPNFVGPLDGFLPGQSARVSPTSMGPTVFQSRGMMLSKAACRACTLVLSR
jgi:hypothetical protein